MKSAAKSKSASGAKIKIGTQMRRGLLKRLKAEATASRRPMSEVIELAVADYLGHKGRQNGDQNGLLRLLAMPPIKVSDADFKKIMEADYYDQ